MSICCNITKIRGLIETVIIYLCTSLGGVEVAAASEVAFSNVQTITGLGAFGAEGG